MSTKIEQPASFQHKGFILLAQNLSQRSTSNFFLYKDTKQEKVDQKSEFLNTLSNKDVYLIIFLFLF